MVIIHMKTALVIALLICFLPLGILGEQSSTGGKHLFILSGQSNMQGHKPEEAFTPYLEERLGASNIIVVQDAQGGQPIHRWWKEWKSPDGEKPETTGDLYDRLLTKVQTAIEGYRIGSVTFIWMQGERDARMKWGSVYEASLHGLYRQLSNDLERDDIFFVNGRLSDFDLKNEKYVDWTHIREIQVKVAESNSRFTWVNTDDLNDGFNRRGKEIHNDLHYSAKGYREFGKRIAAAALDLIRQHQRQPTEE